MKPSLLIVEDDAALAELLEWTFTAEGYRVRRTGDGEEALLMVREEVPDAVILDWMIESLPGIEVCRQLRSRAESEQVPILMLTARGEEDDRIRGIKTGADDYMTKPFSPRELLVRIEALLRRTRPSLSGRMLTFADVELDPASHKVRRAGEAVHLGPTDYKFLLYFLERPKRVHSRQQLIDNVWGIHTDIDDRTVDVHIRRLRKALAIPGSKELIVTVRGAGYALDLA